MTVSSVEIRDSFGKNLPLLNLDRTRDALAAYVERRWRFGRRKSVAIEWDLTDDEARSVCSGHCSWATFDKLISHKRGGWAVLFPIFGALLDQTAEHFIITQRKAHAEHAERLGALVGNFGALDRDRPADRADLAEREAGRGRDRGNRSAQRTR